MEFYDLSALYRLFMIITHLSCIKRKERRDRIQIQRDMEIHHSHPGSLMCPEYSSYTRDPILCPHPSDDDEYDGYIQ